MSGAAIANVLPQDMYGDTLIIGATNDGLAPAVVTPVGDGLGNNSPLELSQTVVNFDRSSGKSWELDGVAVTATAAQINAAGSTTLSVRVVTAAGSVTTTSADDVVIINKTVGAATAVSLYASPTAGDNIQIKDGKGDAAANNITITPAAGTIDGAATLVLNINRQSAWLCYSGFEWVVL